MTGGDTKLWLNWLVALNWFCVRFKSKTAEAVFCIIKDPKTSSPNKPDLIHF